MSGVGQSAIERPRSYLNGRPATLDIGAGSAQMRFMIVTPEAEDSLIDVPVDARILTGDLALPRSATSLVIFAEGSGSSRESPRNKLLTAALQNDGIGTLLIDLLTDLESTEKKMRANVELLTHRLEAVTTWVGSEPDLSGLHIGYFGARTGAAIALGAAADLADRIGAVVARGGRPDLSARELDSVRAPTLLIVGGSDSEMIERNREAYAAIKAEKELRIVPGATHVFEEPGTLEEVARLASGWFKKHLMAA